MVYARKKIAVICKRFTLLCCGLLLAWSSSSGANEFEIARIATEIGSSSEDLVHQLRFAPAYDSVAIQADRLSREAAQLADAINRGRSVSFVESQIKAVSRRYEYFETTFLRASFSSPDAQLYNSAVEISDLFLALSREVLRSNSYYRQPEVYIFTPPVISEHRIPTDMVPRRRISPHGTQRIPQ